jgi:O-glycosyl hydrolase
LDVRVPIAAICLSLFSAALAGDTEWLDAQGRLVRLPLDSGWIDCKSELAVVGSNWNCVAYLSAAGKRQSMIGASGAVWRAELSPDGTMTCRVTQVAQTFSNGVRFVISVQADRSNDCLGVYFILHLPADRFAGGHYAAPGVTRRIPEARAVPYLMGYVPGGEVELYSARDSGRIRLETATNATMLVQDNRRWSDEFAVLAPLCSGALPSGQTVTATVQATGAGEARVPLAEVQVDTARTAYRFDGFGGNYCYGLRGLLARTAFATLRPAWARVEMRLDELKRPSGGDAAADFLRQLAAADAPDSELRTTLEFQALLATNRTPCFIALWRAPKWMHTDGEARQAGNVVKPDEWPRLAAAVGAYLRYARDRYGVEPETFAINEPDNGASIQVPPDVYPMVLRLLEEELRRQGVRTRLALGDVGNPREDARAYLNPALGDPAALQQVSWVSFHSWGGAADDEYAAWAALADRLRLPLVVAEAGVDPDWQHAPVFRHDYAMREMAMYFALLTHARPQAVLLWEHSDDYPVLARDADGRFATTARWGFQKQWIAYTPRGSLAIGCNVLTGDRLDACAFVHGADGAGFTLHLGNRFGTRICRIDKLPPALAALHVVQTTRDLHARAMGDVRPQNGELRIELPAESMTTLTTLTPADLPR